METVLAKSGWVVVAGVIVIAVGLVYGAARLHGVARDTRPNASDFQEPALNRRQAKAVFDSNDVRPLAENVVQGAILEALETVPGAIHPGTKNDKVTTI